VKEKLFHNLGLKLFSLGLAFALWLVVAGEQRIDQALSAPLRVTKLPEGLALGNEPGGAVTVKVRGPKSVVSSLAADEVEVELDLSRLKEGEHLLPIKADQVRVPRGVEVQQIAPSRVRLVLEPVTEREVRVEARVEGTPAPGHYLKRARVHPDRVRVVGPRSAVARVTQVYTSAVSIDGRSRDFAAAAALEPVGHAVKLAGVETVQVSVEIGGPGTRRSR
jgi:YbbR domain-containing protein